MGRNNKEEDKKLCGENDSKREKTRQHDVAHTSLGKDDRGTGRREQETTVRIGAECPAVNQ